MVVVACQTTKNNLSCSFFTKLKHISQMQATMYSVLLGKLSVQCEFNLYLQLLSWNSCVLQQLSTERIHTHNPPDCKIFAVPSAKSILCIHFQGVNISLANDAVQCGVSSENIKLLHKFTTFLPRGAHPLYIHFLAGFGVQGLQMPRSGRFLLIRETI